MAMKITFIYKLLNILSNYTHDDTKESIEVFRFEDELTKSVLHLKKPLHHVIQMVLMYATSYSKEGVILPIDMFLDRTLKIQEGFQIKYFITNDQIVTFIYKTITK